LRSRYAVSDFVGLVKGTPQDVYEWDRNCVLNCDIFVALCDHPSTGLGMELAFAIEHGKHVLAFAHDDTLVSRMILGITYPQFQFDRYRDIADLTAKVSQQLQLLETKIQQPSISFN
jgi:nucleoside 2-deoxyribosyltransferase